MSNSGEALYKVRQTRIEIAIEALCLIGLILIPIVFRGREVVAFYSQPKFFVLHFVAISIVGLWLFELAISASMQASKGSTSWFERMDGWLSQSGHRWSVVIVALFGLTFIVSTILSPMPWVSTWGRDFGDLGYDLYSTLSYLVIFFAVALRTRTQAQFLRIAISLAAVGTFSAGYGVFQAFGWDPIGRGEGLDRVIASHGNPLFLGAHLVMTIPLVIALAVHYESRGKWWVLLPAAISVGLHISALWYAGGRGPWIGGITGLIIFLLASFLWLGWLRAMKGAVLVMTGMLVAVVITSLPGVENRTGRDLSDLSGIFSDVTNGMQYVFKGRSDPPMLEIPTAVQPIPDLKISDPDIVSSPTEQPSTNETAQELVLTVEPIKPSTEDEEVEVSTEEVQGSNGDTQIPASSAPQPLQTLEAPITLTLLQASEIKSFGLVDPTSRSIGNRADIWRGAIELAVTRETVADESKLMRGLRILFGFGPDMYFYSYPQTTRPLGGFEANSHTHNYGLQVLMEQGLTGFLALVTTALLVFIAGISVIRKIARKQSSEPWLAILLIGLIAALVARAVEQGAGVGRVSDLVTFWALMGLVIAATEIDRGVAVRKRPNLRLSNMRGGKRELILIGSVVIASLLGLLVFIQQDLNTMRAGWIAANAFEQKANGDTESAFDSFQKASDLAPNVERYYTETAGFLLRTAAAVEDRERSREFLSSARSTLFEYEKRDPLAWQTQLDLSNITKALVSLGDDELKPEVITRFLNLSKSMKSFAGVQSNAAANIVIAGDYELGLTIAEQAIALESSTQPLHRAWWALGEIMFQSNRVDDAELAWTTALDRYHMGIYIAASHRGLAFINEGRGDLEQANVHRRIAEDLDPS